MPVPPLGKGQGIVCSVEAPLLRKWRVGTRAAFRELEMGVGPEAGRRAGLQDEQHRRAAGRRGLGQAPESVQGAGCHLNPQVLTHCLVLQKKPEI